MYRTLITLLVLSEEQIPEDWDVATIATECDKGAFVGQELERQETELTRQQTAAALTAAGSEPAFLLKETGWKYALAAGDEIRIDSGDNEDQGSVIIQHVEIIESADPDLDVARITDTDGQQFECLLKEIS